MRAATAHVAGFRALGTDATVMTTRARAQAAAVQVVQAEVAAIDVACSRFRADSELVALNAAPGRPVAVSALLFEAVRVALAGAAATQGRVDPTLGARMAALGYDRDFRSVPPDGPPLDIRLPGSDVESTATWRDVELDPATRTIVVPAGLELDLGASAKSWAADRAAAAAGRAARAIDGEAGVLVSLGGDVAVAGAPPPDGWSVLVTDDHGTAADPDGQVITIADGGLATSGITVRRWRRGQVELHHLLDPTTGRPVDAVWRTATVAAASCLEANLAATAAVVAGPEAPSWLAAQGLAARLVATDGRVECVAGWPPC